MYKCNIKNCEYESNGQCNYCGDFYDLNDPDCMAFEEEYKSEGDEQS